MIHIVSFHQIAITIPVYRPRTAGLPLQSIENSCMKKKKKKKKNTKTLHIIREESNYHRFSTDIVSSQKKHLLLEPQEKQNLSKKSPFILFFSLSKKLYFKIPLDKAISPNGKVGILSSLSYLSFRYPRGILATNKKKTWRMSQGDRECHHHQINTTERGPPPPPPPPDRNRQGTLPYLGSAKKS